uniref:Eyes shut homolog n=1 Tax=Hippocampus comes TaxID=109280 RepID=A0A3Q2YCK1_HIPCM
CLCPIGFSGSFCEKDVDYCVDHSCSEHGICVGQRWNFTCRCALGYEGALCELETNECDILPCANGATCEDLVGDYRCHCSTGFEHHGSDCSSSVNPCVSNLCDPDGTLRCEGLANTYMCVCQRGFTGTRCETPINHCVDGLCQYGSTCLDHWRGFKCDCLPRYCELNINDCE